MAKILKHGRLPASELGLGLGYERAGTTDVVPRVPESKAPSPDYDPILNATDAAVLSHIIVILPPASLMSVNSHVS